MKRTLFIFLLLCSSLALRAQSAHKEYLEKYSATLDINDNDDYSSFAMLDTVIDKYTVFFTGETHRTDGNMEVRWKMLKYLYHKAGVRVLIIEAPYSYGWLLNHYMSSNDSVSYFRCASYESSAKSRIFYQTLYMFNRSKPAHQRIIIRGIDTEDTHDVTSEALSLLFGKKPLPRALRNEVAGLIHHGKKELAHLLLQKLQSDTAYSSYYGNDYPAMTAILEGLSCRDCEPLKRKATSATWLNREALMYNNYLDALKEFPGVKFYGQFGKAHICLNPGPHSWFRVKSWDPVASRLNRNDDSPVKGKVCSIGLDYYYVIDEVTKEERELMQAFILADESRAFVMHKLDQPDSPFAHAAQSYQYMINICYDYRDEISYNVKNDHYKLMNTDTYTSIVVYAGYQRWNRQAIELGAGALSRDMKKVDYRAGIGLFFEFNPNQRLHSYRAAAWGGRGPVQVGISPVFSTSYRSSAFFLRPEMGLKVREYSLTYGYNAKLYNRSLTGFNTHMLTLRAFLVLDKD